MPAGEFYVLGDNRAGSCDSRYWEPVKGPSIVGKVVLVWWHDGHPACTCSGAVLSLGGTALVTAGLHEPDHGLNPAWPPHARFHNATGWGTLAGSQLVALWLLWRPGQQTRDRDMAMTTAALLGAIAWLPFFPALAISGADVEDEPGHLRRVAGVPINLVPAALIPASCALGYVLHRHGQ